MRNLALYLLATLLFSSALRSSGFAAGGATGTTPPTPAQDGTLPALTAIAGQGLMEIHAYQELEDSATRLGGG